MKQRYLVAEHPGMKQPWKRITRQKTGKLSSGSHSSLTLIQRESCGKKKKKKQNKEGYASHKPADRRHTGRNKLKTTKEDS